MGLSGIKVEKNIQFELFICHWIVNLTNNKAATMPRKLMKFLILFDNTSLLYFPGQFLSGRVLLELQEDTPALGE